MRKLRGDLKRIILLISSILLIGCSTVNNLHQVNNSGEYEIDPYEKLNRGIFVVNQKLDSWFLHPIAKGYNFIFPQIIRQGISNVYGVLADLNTSVNRLLQGNIRGFLANANRVLINISFGICGVFDIADYWGIKKDHSDFGITLASWGSKHRPFVMLPFFGSATLNEVIGKPIDAVFLNVWVWIPSHAVQWGAIGGYYVQSRAALVDSDSLLKQAFDPYIFIRDAYLQHREYLLEYDPYRRDIDCIGE